MKQASAMGVLLAGLVAVGAAWAAVPQQMTFQGRLTDGDTLVSGAGLPLTLSLYDGAASGANLLYREVDAVNVVDGLYSTVIGDNPESGTAAYTALADALEAGGASTWLGIALNGGAEFSPRIQILSAPFAMQANERDPAFSGSAASAITEQQITEWSAAYSWGNHAAEGYITDASGAAGCLSTNGGAMAGSINMNNHALENAIIMPAGDLTMGAFNHVAP